MSAAVVAQRSGSAGERAGTRSEPIPPLWLTVPARAGQLPGLRRALREWLSQAGVGEHDITGVLVAVGEATSNAVEHAYADIEPGLVRLTARLDAEELVIEVIDNGHWRPQSDPGQRGRGLPLMRATMDQVDVDGGNDGTTVHMRMRLPQGSN